MKRNSLITLVVLTLALLVSAFSRTTQSPALEKVGFGFQPSVQAATDASPASNAAYAFLRIPITLTFGRAKKKCGGWGICKITLGKLSAAEKGRTVQAELSRTDDGKLELRVLGKAAEEGPTFFVDEDVPLSADIAKQLGVRSAVIQRGEYAFSASKSRLNARLTK